MSPEAKLPVRHNERACRFEVEEGGHLALCEYELSPSVIVFTHTEVPPALGGRGIAGQMAKAGLDFARGRGLQVVPQCAFIASYIQKHPECHDLVHPDHRARLGL